MLHWINFYTSCKTDNTSNFFFCLSALCHFQRCIQDRNLMLWMEYPVSLTLQERCHVICWESPEKRRITECGGTDSHMNFFHSPSLWVDKVTVPGEVWC